MLNIELNLGVFDGFYHSHYSDEIDDIVEGQLEELDITYDDAKTTYNWELLAKDILLQASKLYEEFDFISNITFSELVSPREYNFTNDKIYFNCDFDKIKFSQWIVKIMSDHDEYYFLEVSEMIHSHHTSAPGFISFHSNDIVKWIEDLLNFDEDNKDHVYKLGFFVSAYIKSEQFEQTGDSNSIELQIIEDLNMNGDINACIEVQPKEAAEK